MYVPGLSVTVSVFEPPVKVGVAPTLEPDEDSIVVAGISERGPAAKTRLRPGDRILAVRDEPVSSLASFWRKVWASGPAGSEVVLQIVRDNDPMVVRIPSADRTQMLKSPRLH